MNIEFQQNKPTPNNNIQRKFKGGKLTKRFILMPIIIMAIAVDGYCQNNNAKEDQYKPRVIISTDFPPLDVIPGDGCDGPNHKCSDPDDIQSMVRFLLYTNEFDVEALIASAATFANIADKQNILDIINIYDKIDENLRGHDPGFPKANYLRSVTYEGRDGTWGQPVEEILGEGMDSEASEAIIRIVDHPDPRPVWVCVWGGPREVAQAFWKVKNTRSPDEVDKFISKLRIYQIGLGDDPGQDGSGHWILNQFLNLFVISSQDTYSGMSAQDSELGNLEWINTNIRWGHGLLGRIYPETGFHPDNPGVQEGDTPSFLYLVSAVYGINDPEKPNQESWGGQFVQKDTTTNHWFDGPGPESVSKWREEYQEDFARRADWMLPE
ncbi:MAG: DUF1593 domain-containing protein [Bacteroidales bacterium]